MNSAMDYFQGFVFVYGTLMLLLYAVLAILSLRGILKYNRRNKYIDYNKLLNSPLAPGISIVAPAFNEGLTILSNVHSLMTLNYPSFEVIIVNDGSTDNTLELLIADFALVQVDFAYNERIKTQPVRKIFKSTNKAYDKLLVIDKVNGKSKADASNAGVNAAAFKYFLCTDVDSVIEKNTLLKMIKPFMDEEMKKIHNSNIPCSDSNYIQPVDKNIRVIATGATLRLANSCDIDEGVIVRVRPPRRLFPRFQEMEYIRAFVMGKMGWSLINCVSNVSGGLGLFDKDIAIKAGGYDGKSLAEDMDIVTRMNKYMLDNNLRYAVRYIPTSQCWTEGPTTLKILGRQRTRWGRGLIEVMVNFRKMIFNPRYRREGLIVLPYNLFFEFLAPIIEVIGIIFYIYLICTHHINAPNAIVLFSFVYLYSVMITTLAICWDQLVYKYYKSWKEVIGLALMAFLEPFIYHPLIVFF
ncbi:MAG TPA: glycosyltransferase family 2 protein, partial [Arachidicoccus soli]|nr:glycosyltransferase family 2 protein [Arachidicoccus soli]